MKYFILLTFLVFNGLLSMAQQNPLTKYQWKNRLLIIYSSKSDNDKLQEQINKFRFSTAEYNERELLVFHLSNNDFQNLNENVPVGSSISAMKDFLSLQYEEDFKVFLIGKDGGIKLKSKEVLSNQKLFATIDAMPMRQNEMERDY